MYLHLKDGTKISGESFGSDNSASGEVVFNTGMTGYVESLTDPSYAGQILVCTFPLIGNYGVPEEKYFESNKIQVAGLVVSEYSDNYSHANAKVSLGTWLKRSGVPAITGVDTRALTKKLREHGVMLGALSDTKPSRFMDPNKDNLVAKVSPTEVRTYGTGKKKIVLVDCGAKENIVRSLVARDVTVIRVPWDYDFTKLEYDGLLLSNGPGDPTQCGVTIANIKKAMAQKRPILGICLGNQLLALAAGAKTYKLKYGHRSHNQPCVDVIGRPYSASDSAKATSDKKATKGRCYITSQNHGFAVNEKTLSREWESWFVNANDASNEGIRHKKMPWRSAQFHPEASPGPTDTAWLFDEFISTLL